MHLEARHCFLAQYLKELCHHVLYVTEGRKEGRKKGRGGEIERREGRKRERENGRGGDFSKAILCIAILQYSTASYTTSVMNKIIVTLARVMFTGFDVYTIMVFGV